MARLNVTDAARYTGISKSTLEKRRVSGGGPRYIKIGNRVVYDEHDLDAWMEGNKQESTTDGELPPPRRKRSAAR